MVRMKFNRNSEGQLADGELQQDQSLKVRVTDLDISFLSLVWIILKFMVASVVATMIIAVILMVVTSGLDVDFHALQFLQHSTPR